MEIENKTPEPSFFAVIPATVRYEKIPDGAKLLYGEISALCNKKGYCWAGNDHFAELYNVNERTVRNWLEALKEKGHISVFYKYVPGKKEIESRFIRITCAETVKKTRPDEKPPAGPPEPPPSPPPAIGLPADEVGKNFSIGGEKIFHTSGNNFPKVGKNFSKGGEKNCRDNNTINNKTTTTTAENPPDLIEDAPASDETPAAAVLSPEEIKNALKAINRSLLLKTDFYSRASAFMSLNCLDPGYFAWLYKQVELRNPDSFEGLYFTLFFADNMVEKYKLSKLPEEKPPPLPPPDFKCPVCGTVHDKNDDECPLCSLPRDAPPERVVLHRELLSLSPDKRKEYLEKEDLLSGSFRLDAEGIVNFNNMKKELNREFGITISNEEPSRSYNS